jgi:phosphomannomutase/phosphoglucomutase
MADVAGRFGDAPQKFMVVIDAGNGMGGMFAPTLLKYMRHDILELYCDPDGTYPNHPADPFDEENLLDLKGVVLTKDADLGLAFDGDADRFGMIDSAGYAHPIDRLLIPLVWDVLKQHPGATIVTDPLVSQILIDTITASGGKPLMWKSGHSNIKNKMKAEGAPLALETSGHVFIADDYYGYDDGIYAGLRMVELLSREKSAPLAEIMAEIPRLHTTPQFRPECAESKKKKVIKAVARHFRDDEIIDVDGVRVVREEGWFIVRASNTEARLSLRFEGSSEDALNQMIDEVAGLLQEQGVHLNGE